MEISLKNSFVDFAYRVNCHVDCALRCCEHSELHKERTITMDVYNTANLCLQGLTI